MTDAVLIGCRGWEYDDWTPALYPEELPAEWRFCFYSNEIRAVLVPYPTALEADAVQWHEECDEEFRFVFEFPVADVGDDVEGALGRLIAHTQPLAGRTSAFMIRLAPRHELPVPRLERLCRMCEPLPACVEVPEPGGAGVGGDTLDRWGVSRVWHASAPPPASPGGGFLIALLEGCDLPALRRTLEHLHAHAQAGRGAALFFTDPTRAVDLVRQARIMAELMGV